MGLGNNLDQYKALEKQLTVYFVCYVCELQKSVSQSSFKSTPTWTTFLFNFVTSK